MLKIFQASTLKDDNELGLKEPRALTLNLNK